tara:strand:+ start:60 stop:386 length:327 start_codon:yes stop_codon:yes gene_type:complete
MSDEFKKLIKENEEFRYSKKIMKDMYDDKIEYLSTQNRYLLEEVEEYRYNNNRLNTLVNIIYNKEGIIKELNERLASKCIDNSVYPLILDVIYTIMNDSGVLSFSYDV